MLAGDVAAFSLTYYDADGALTSDPASVWRVAIEVTVTRDATSGTVRTEVFPRAFRPAFVVWEEE